MRIDKWLWAARFYKTRSLASKAVNSGKVKVKQQKTKASRTIATGDELNISRGYAVITIVIDGLNEHRRPAPEAQSLYHETEDSIKQRQDQQKLRQSMALSTPKVAGKPNKKQRRQHDKFKWQ